ncbi:hypothetical protein HGRIS_004754 [Hohenbuehelia grisea]|uniref:Uncharacterized protein n=1 Tax=Hohenbuehelia grisea TaxID=104357 RepID=A0ABR3JDN8_9AGAR
MNRTPTIAVQGMTPYEATWKKKPDLRNIREWGEKVYVAWKPASTSWVGASREGGGWGLTTKAQACASTGRIEGDNRRRNVYFDESAPRFEGRNGTVSNRKLMGLPPPRKLQTRPRQQPGEDITHAETPPIENPPTLDGDVNDDNVSEAEDPPTKPEGRPTRTRRPTARIQDLLAGGAVASNLPRGPKVAEESSCQRHRLLPTSLRQRSLKSLRELARRIRC